MNALKKLQIETDGVTKVPSVAYDQKNVIFLLHECYDYAKYVTIRTIHGAKLMENDIPLHADPGKRTDSQVRGWTDKQTTHG